MRRLLVTLIVIATTAATPCGARGRLVVVVIGGTSLHQLHDSGLRHISVLVRDGAIGVMNVRPATLRPDGNRDILAGYTMESCCASIGAGTRTAVTVDARSAYDSGDLVQGRKASSLYRALYGADSGMSRVLHLGMNRTRYANEESSFPVEPGALGTALRRAGFRTAAVGNSDIPGELHREAAAIVADGLGVVDNGHVGEGLTVADPDFPYGVRCDPDRLFLEFRRALSASDVIVVDVGDTARAASYSSHCLDAQGRAVMRRALYRADHLVGRITRLLDLDRDRLILLSTHQPPQSLEEFDFLPPVVVKGSGIEPGLLTSGSTRRPGIVTNADISASVLDFVGLRPPVSFVGRPVTSRAGRLADLSQVSDSTASLMERQPVARGLGAFLTVFAVLCGGYVLSRRATAQYWASWAALLPAAAVLAVTWMPVLGQPSPAESVVLMGGLSAAILAVSWVLTRSPGASFLLICAATVVTTIADLAGGGELMRTGILSYTPVDGSRYYGIGNELMGALISAAMVLGGFIASVLPRGTRYRTGVMVSYLLLVVLAVGLPSLGANAGGAMSAAAAAAVGLVIWRGRPLTRAAVVAIILSVPAALGLMALADVLRSGSAQSHVGRAVELAASGGIGQIVTLIVRKLQMNLTLIQFSVWSRLLLALAVTSAAMLWAGHLEVLARLRKSPDVHTGIIAAAVGSLAALLLNDSGIVAAATAFIYVWTALALTALAVPRETTGE